MKEGEGGGGVGFVGGGMEEGRRGETCVWEGLGEGAWCEGCDGRMIDD